MTIQPINRPTNEQKWRDYWQSIDLYQTGDDSNKPDIYILDFFPYPSGDGLSVGHGRNYVPTCVSARFQRMNGYNVLHPMGWDAFGLPAENYAVKHNIHPRESTRIFTDTYRRQMKLLECSYDWSREINSTDPDYYRWTQWFFLLLYQRGLAYRAESRQWWCDECQTILANEQVEDGRCWRCATAVTRKSLNQWHFNITAYADRLLADLDSVDWPEPIKIMQRNWIGRSEGAEVRFQTDVGVISVFTTRPDTLYGVTFLVLAPEHPLVGQITTPQQATAVADYIQQAQHLSEIDRTMGNRPKTGVFTGTQAIHPLSGETIPIWIADYVLMEYGTGAIMAVPAHDERDFAFAQQYDLPIVETITPDGIAQGNDVCFTDYGTLINANGYSGMVSAEAIAQIIADLTASGKGQAQTTTKMRDWLISRQRYWGAPIPIIHCPDCGTVPVPEDDLPVRLPETDDFAPSGDGRSPLARIESWVNTICPQCGQSAQRETDTMDGFACSSWYFLRFASPHEGQRPFDPEAVERWLPVDIYVGGAEHAVMHLLYARFWTKVMYDAGLVDFTEPFTTLKNQGMLLSGEDGQKMSKSRGNVVTPDEIVAQCGTDALRAYLLFLGPFHAEVTWTERGIKGVIRFLDRFWALANEVINVEGQSPPRKDKDKSANSSLEFEKARHKIIKRVTDDMADFRFNTAVAALMAYLNTLFDFAATAAITPDQWRSAIETVTLLLAPICPFIAEDVWQTVLGQDGTVHRQSWPVYDEAMLVETMITLPVQVNGKLRDRIEVAVDADEEMVRTTAVVTPGVQRHIDGQAIQQIIIVPGKMVNIVTRTKG